MKSVPFKNMKVFPAETLAKSSKKSVRKASNELNGLINGPNSVCWTFAISKCRTLKRVNNEGY